MSLSTLPPELLGLIGDNDIKILNPLSKLNHLLRRRLLPFLGEVPITKREMLSFVDTQPLIIGSSIEDFYNIFLISSELLVQLWFSARYPRRSYFYNNLLFSKGSLFSELRRIIECCGVLDLHSQYIIYSMRRTKCGRKKVLNSFDQFVSEYRQNPKDPLDVKHITITRMVCYLIVQMNCLQIPVTFDHQSIEYCLDSGMISSRQRGEEQLNKWEQQIESGIQEVRKGLEQLP